MRCLRVDDRLVEDLLGGGEVLLGQQRRHRQHVADVVEAVAGVVGGEIVGRLEVDADQVADRVVVFVAVEPADRDAAGVARAGAVAVSEGVLDPRQSASRRPPAAAAARSSGGMSFAVMAVGDVLPDFSLVLDGGERVKRSSAKSPLFLPLPWQWKQCWVISGRTSVLNRRSRARVSVETCSAGCCGLGPVRVSGLDCRAGARRVKHRADHRESEHQEQPTNGSRMTNHVLSLFSQGLARWAAIPWRPSLNLLYGRGVGSFIGGSRRLLLSSGRRPRTASFSARLRIVLEASPKICTALTVRVSVDGYRSARFRPLPLVLEESKGADGCSTDFPDE